MPSSWRRNQRASRSAFGLVLKHSLGSDLRQAMRNSSASCSGSLVGPARAMTTGTVSPSGPTQGDATTAPRKLMSRAPGSPVSAQSSSHSAVLRSNPNKRSWSFRLSPSTSTRWEKTDPRFSPETSRLDASSLCSRISGRAAMVSPRATSWSGFLCLALIADKISN